MAPKKKQEETWSVETILDSREDKKGKLEYLVKWEDYPSSENTWEPAAHLASCKEAIAAFNKSKAKKPAKAAAAPAKSPAKKADAPAVPLSLTRPKRGAEADAPAPEPKKAKAAPPPPKPKAKAAPPPPPPKPKAPAPPKSEPKINSKQLAKLIQKEVSKAEPKKAKASTKPASKPKPASEDEDLMQVEKILGMRASKKFGVEYQIQWKGGRKSKETSWEPEENVMDDDLIDEFEEALQEKTFGSVTIDVGDKVEVRNVDGGFENSWTGAVVKEKKKSGKFGVEYTAFVDDKGKKMADTVERSRLRPTQSTATSSWAPQVGEIVEVNDADCWWEARVQGVKGKTVTVMFRVSDEEKDLSLGSKVRPCAWLKMAAPSK